MANELPRGHQKRRDAYKMLYEVRETLATSWGYGKGIDVISLVDESALALGQGRRELCSLIWDASEVWPSACRQVY